MNADAKVPHRLIANHFLGQATEQEEEQLRGWMCAADGNRQLYSVLEENWALARYKEPAVVPDKEKTWNEIRKKTGLLLVRKYLYTRWDLVRVASLVACVALIVGSSVAWWVAGHSVEVQQVRFSTESGHRSQMILPDGTRVWLNANTQITYSSNYNVSNRNVELDGEAYFDVVKSTERPFLVNVGEVVVKVHGTKFNVKAPKASPSISVSLEEGKVSLLTSHNDHLLTTLYPNQQAVVARHSLVCRVASCNSKDESLWHLNQLLFDDMPAEEVWQKLEGWYGVKFNVQNMKKGTAYRFALKTESLTELLTMINQLTPMDYKVNGEEVTLTYK